MSDIAAETRAYVEMVDEAIKRIETQHSGVSGALGDWQGLFDQTLDELPTPQEITDVIGQFDDELTNLAKAIPGELCDAIESCSQEFAKLQSDTAQLQGLWQQGFDTVHRALDELAGSMQQFEGDLTTAFNANLGQAITDCLQLLDQAVTPFLASGDTWGAALQGEQLATFGSAWQHFSDNLAGQHTGSAQQFVEDAGGQATQAFEHFVDSAVKVLSELGDGLQDSLETLSTHLSGQITDTLQSAIEQLIQTGVHELQLAIVEAVGAATIGEAITGALASSGVLEILIPLNLAIDMILRAIEIFKDPTSIFSG